jgi:hypothetical protein
MVTDGISGFLFERGNWRQLAEQLEVSTPPGLVTALAEGISDIKSEREMFIEYIEIYRPLLSAPASFTLQRTKTRRSK